MQDPELYLDRLETTLRCPVHRDQDAVLEASHRAYVNHEVFFFSSPDVLEDFKRRPLRYVEEVTDPVSLVHFAPTEESPFYEYNQRPYFFAEKSTLASFRAAPERYATAKRGMSR